MNGVDVPVKKILLLVELRMYMVGDPLWLVAELQAGVAKAYDLDV